MPRGVAAGNHGRDGFAAGSRRGAATARILEFCPDSASTSRRLCESQSFWQMPGVKIRYAKDADLDGLEGLERQSFASDRLARRSLRRLISHPTAALRVAAEEPGGPVHGYGLVLFRKGSSVARLYSIAVAARQRGAGFGRQLLADAEAVAAGRGHRVLRLEVREDNRGAIRFYEAKGYRLIGRREAYYADGMDALRYEKALARTRPARRRGN